MDYKTDLSQYIGKKYILQYKNHKIVFDIIKKDEIGWTNNLIYHMFHL